MTGGDRDNLRRTFKPTDTPALQSLVDSSIEINGTWRLRVADRQPADLGKLNSWRLKLHT